MLNEIIVPYVKKERESKGLGEQQKAVVIMDVFTGQMTSGVKGVFKESHILVTNVPANMTRVYQPLDLTVNENAKRLVAKKFNSWYSQQICDELESGKPLEEIDIKVRLSTLKPLHAACVVDFYNYITSAEAKEIVINDWKSAGIYEALKHGSKNLPNMDSFHNIYPLMDDNPTTVETNLDAVYQLDQEQFNSFRSQRDNEEDHEDKEKHGNLKTITQMHSTYLITLMTNHLCKILSTFGPVAL